MSRLLFALAFCICLSACSSLTPIAQWDRGLLARSERHALQATEKKLFSGDEALLVSLGQWRVENPNTRSERDDSWTRPGSVRVDDYPDYTEQRSLEESESQTILSATLSHPQSPPWHLRCRRDHHELNSKTETHHASGATESESNLLESSTHLDCQLGRRNEQISLFFDAANGHSELAQLQSGEKTYPLRPIYPAGYRDQDGKLVESSSFRAAFSGGANRVVGFYVDCAPNSPCAALEIARQGGGLWLERDMPKSEQEQLLAGALAWWLSNEAFDLN